MLRAKGAPAWSSLSRVLHTDFCPWANRFVYWPKEPVGWFLVAIAVILLSGLVSRGLLAGPIDRLIARGADETGQPGGFDRLVPPWLVGAVCLAGLIAFSIVACYAYHPEPSETLEEIKIARVEASAGVTSRQYETALYWIPIWDDWSCKLEVGHALRNFELRPYQKARPQLLRKKLELLEHEIEQAMELEKTARTIVPPLDHHHPEPNSESADGGHGHHGHDDHDHGDHDHAHDDHEHHHPEEVYLELRALTRSLSETSRRLSEAFLTPWGAL